LSTTSASRPAPIGYGDLIRGNRNFRYLWFGQIVSLLGDWFNLIASASLVGELTQSEFAVGGLFVIRMLAPFLVSPMAGVVADRYNRKHILIIADVTRALTVLGFLFVRNAGQIWLLYALTAIQLGISGFFFPTRTAILPDLVPPRGLGAANVISSTTWSVMLALGAAIGGLVSGYWGMYPAFIIDSLSFLLSALLISQIRLDARPGLAAAERTIRAALQQYLDGLRYLRGHADILVIAMPKAAIALIMFSGFQVVQVAIAKDIFVLGIGGGISLGLMFGINGAGTGIGPIAARRFTGDRDRSLRRAIFLGYLIGVLGLAITGTLINFGTVLLGTLLRGVGGGIIWVFSTQLLLQLVPGHIRGRIFATEFASFTLASAVGAALAGALLDSSIGISGLIWWMAGLSLIPAALWALWLGRGKAADLAPEDAGI
jgi:MFS family permease